MVGLCREGHIYTLGHINKIHSFWSPRPPTLKIRAAPCAVLVSSWTMVLCTCWYYCSLDGGRVLLTYRSICMTEIRIGPVCLASWEQGYQPLSLPFIFPEMFMQRAAIFCRNAILRMTRNSEFCYYGLMNCIIIIMILYSHRFSQEPSSLTTTPIQMTLTTS